MAKRRCCFWRSPENLRSVWRERKPASRASRLRAPVPPRHAGKSLCAVRTGPSFQAIAADPPQESFRVRTAGPIRRPRQQPAPPPDIFEWSPNKGCSALQQPPSPVTWLRVTQTKTRVVVGMSGGVDSSAAAALLLEQGYDVVGITLKLWPQDCVSRAEDKCCGPQAVMDARNVSHRLGIPYYLVDEADDFQKQVINYFAEEYKAGRTPNPCVMCNEKLKFGKLINRERQLRAEFVATGHFARIEKQPDTGRYLLKRGKDSKKDQSYFLFSLKQEQLARSLFPLGELTKSDTR